MLKQIDKITDSFIKTIAIYITKKIAPSKLLKIELLLLVLSVLLGNPVAILVLISCTWLVTEFLYAQISEEDDS